MMRHAVHTCILLAMWVWTTRAFAASLADPLLSDYIAGTWRQVITAAGVAQAGGIAMLTIDVLRSKDQETSFGRRVGTTIAAGLLVGVGTHLIWEAYGWSRSSHVLALLIAGAVGNRILDAVIDPAVKAVSERVVSTIRGKKEEKQ